MAAITGQQYTVQSGDNLYKIVKNAAPGLSDSEVHNRVQKMIADNPEHAQAIKERRLQVGVELDISAAFGDNPPPAPDNKPASQPPADSAVNNLNGNTTGNPIMDAILAEALGLNDPERKNEPGNFSNLLINGGDPVLGTDLGLANQTFGQIANNLSGVNLIFDPNVILRNVFG